MNFAFLRKLDWFLISLTVILFCLSLLAMVGVSARAPIMMERHAIAFVISFVAMLVAASFDYRYFRSFSAPVLLLYGGAVFFLVIVLAFGQVRGISAWIRIFNAYSFQPSEFGKLATLLILSKYFSLRHREIYQWRHILVSGVYAGIPALLTLLQPDFGSMFVYLVLWGVMLLASGIKRSHIGILFGIGLAGFAIAWLFLFAPYQKDRILSFLHPQSDVRGRGYNAAQSQVTFGSGGITGSFLNRMSDGKRIIATVPEPYTDFAFSIFGQKFGFLGTLFYMLCFFLICQRIGGIALRSRTNFEKLFSIGFISILIVHALINMGMNLGIFPITGIPLTFMSYGGSHMLTMMIGIGIIESFKVYSS